MIIKLLFLFLCYSHAALDARYDDYDGFELVQALIDDGKLDLAQKELDGMTREEKRHASFSYLSGVVQFKRNKYSESEKYLIQAEFALDTPESVSRDLFLARSQYFLERYEKCATSFKNGIKSPLLNDDDVVYRAKCEQKTPSLDRAWKVLAQALIARPSLTILQATNEFLLAQGLTNVATQISLDWLARYSKQISDFITIAELFNTQKQPAGRLAVLEMGRVKYPLDIDLNLHLNQIYYEKGMLLAVEEGFSRAALVDGKYAYHAAEINRQAGRYERSQFFNASIPDEKERLKQKLAIYVDKGQFALIASMEPALQRSSLINDDEVRYALAYSLVRSGQYKRPLEYLAKITNKDLLEKTVVLRNALTECQQKNTSCNL